MTGDRAHREPGPPPTLYIQWLSDEYVRIALGRQVIMTVNHSYHGWDGMEAAIVAAARVAQAFGSTVETLGVPNRDIDLSPLAPS